MRGQRTNKKGGRVIQARREGGRWEEWSGHSIPSFFSSFPGDLSGQVFGETRSVPKDSMQCTVVYNTVQHTRKHGFNVLYEIISQAGYILKLRFTVKYCMYSTTV